MMQTYRLRTTSDAAPLDAAWDGCPWREAEEARLEHFHPAGTVHRPQVKVRMLYDRANLYLRYRVADRFVIARNIGYQASVSRDSCVEFFVQPRPGTGYFNFEINCGGSLLIYYIEDHTRTADGFAKYTPVAEKLGSQVEIRHTLPQQIEAEIAAPTEWEVACRIPLAVLETYVGRLGPLPGQEWRGNFYKCADDSSHPHWGSWSPIGAELNFHQPGCFGDLRFV
jgi:hypothetical protein